MTGGRSGNRRRDESGATLIEVLVAVVIMGIAFVVIVGGIGTAIIGSDLQRQRATADVALRTAAERIVGEIPYTPCATSADYVPAAVPGVEVTVTAVSYWNKDDNTFVTTPCSDSGLQLIELSAVATSGRQTIPDTLRVVKRRP